jgi:hypothetical protein
VIVLLCNLTLAEFKKVSIWFGVSGTAQDRQRDHRSRAFCHANKSVPA